MDASIWLNRWNEGDGAKKRIMTENTKRERVKQNVDATTKYCYAPK